MKKVLAVINISVIAILLLISCIMVYFSSSKSRELFGYTMLLYHPIKAQSPCLYIINSSSTSVNVGDEVVLHITSRQGKTTVVIDTIAKKTDSTLLLLQNDATINLLSTDYTVEYSTIAYSNATIGRIISAITNDLSPVLVCVIIIGGTIIFGLIWMIIIMRRKGRTAYFTAASPIEVLINYDDTVDENTANTQTENEQILISQESTAHTAENDDINTPMEFSTHTLSFDTNALLEEIIANASKEFMLHQNDDISL